MIELKTNFELSSNRIQKLLSGDKAKATEMGVVDRFLDAFRSTSKLSQLEQLFDELQKKDNPIDQFVELAKLAKPSHIKRFSVLLEQGVKITRESHENHWGSLVFSFDASKRDMQKNPDYRVAFRIDNQIIAKRALSRDEISKQIGNGNLDFKIVRGVVQTYYDEQESSLGTYITRRKYEVLEFTKKFERKHSVEPELPIHERYSFYTFN